MSRTVCEHFVPEGLPCPDCEAESRPHPDTVRLDNLSRLLVHHETEPAWALADNITMISGDAPYDLRAWLDGVNP